MYLAFREANNAKWRAVRHLVEPEPDAAFNRQNVDLEEARVDKVPQALDGKNVLDNSVEHEPSVENIAERSQASEMELMRALDWTKSNWMLAMPQTLLLQIALWMTMKMMQQ